MFVLLTASPRPAAAQAGAATGVIEGAITDDSGGAMPGIPVTVLNLDSGLSREAVSNDQGAYSALLLPPGTYRVQIAMQGFKTFERSGVTLGAGQTARIDVRLEVGDMSETIQVTSDAPVVDTAKIDAGRTLTSNEVKNLPLVSRNPYNFALLQPGVTGFENPEFGVPRFSANGTLLRINYQIDGNTNTQKDRAGLRLLPVSEVMVSEVKVVTSGYAPEFGQTTGLVYNAITPSGTNQIRGAGAFRFRRKAFSAFPFFFQGDRTDERRPDTRVDTTTGELGGPIIKDRLHFYTGFENTFRDLSAQSVITVRPEDAARIGLAAQPAVVPREQTGRFFIGKADYQLSSHHRLTGRTLLFRNDSPNNMNGQLNTIDRTNDFLDSMDSTAFSLVSMFGANTLNELRVQYARRVQDRFTNELSGMGPAVDIPGVASFGGPIGATDQAGFSSSHGIWQVIDNVTLQRGTHTFKTGFDLQFVRDRRELALLHLYTFPTIDAYLSARDGRNPFAYTNVTQLVGDPALRMTSSALSGFVQDDWRVSSSLKVLYGVRYDYYDYPAGEPSSPFEFSREHRNDGNNLGTRLGIAWTPDGDHRSVVRASTGIMFDQILLGPYESAMQQNGLTSRLTVSMAPTAPGAPAYPASLANLPPGYVLPTPNIFAIDPEFQVGRTWQNNFQYERTMGQQYYGSIGYTYVRGTSLPVIGNINLINPVSTLEDGRPVYSTAINANTRMDPRFNQINVVQSLGESTYHAMIAQVGKRLSDGIQFDFSYTLGKGEDTAPMTTALATQGDDGRSDPSNLERDKGPNILDVRHTLAGSVVAQPRIAVGNRVLSALLNGNQFGLMVQFNSGVPMNLRSNIDLNRDGVLADRPLFVGRNSIYLPARYNADLRVSRFVPFGRMRLEVSGEFKNVMNTVQVSNANRIINTNDLGVPLAALPLEGDDLRPTAGYEQRQFQLGFKLHF